MSIMLGKISVRDLHGPWSDFMEKLQTEDSVEWFEAFKKMLRKENPWPSCGGKVISNFPVWKTIKLGTNLKTVDDFRSALKQAKMKIGNWGNDILGKPAFTVSERECDVDLVVMSVKDLGFKDRACCRDIIAKALSFGLGLCPAEVGPALCLQPEGEWLVIGMEPITDSGGDSLVFCVAHCSDERWLDGSCGYPDSFWGAGNRFVFVRPSK